MMVIVIAEDADGDGDAVADDFGRLTCWRCWRLLLLLLLLYASECVYVCVYDILCYLAWSWMSDRQSQTEQVIWLG